MQLPEKQEILTEFFFGFLESSLNFENFQKEISLIGQIFPKLGTPKNMVRSFCKRSRF